MLGKVGRRLCSRRWLNQSVMDRYILGTKSSTSSDLRTNLFNVHEFSSTSRLCIELFKSDGSLTTPPQDLDYFTIFGIKRTFAVDPLSLSKEYKQLQRQLHPDRFTLKPEQEKEKSEVWSALVNSGYNSLLKPLPRALYLLELLGKPLEEGDITIASPFLMEMMELNEELLEADSIGIEHLGLDIRKRIDGYIERIETAFKNGNIDEARSEVAHMKYLANILDKIVQLEQVKD